MVLQPDRAEQREARDRGRPWRRRCGRTARRRQLGAADVRAPPQHLGRHADGHLRRRRRDLLRVRPAARPRCPAVCPSSVLRAFRACCSPVCSWGMVARVLSSRVVAWVTSSSDVAPLRKRDWAISSPCSCTLTFARASSMSTSKVADDDVGSRDLRGQRDEGRVVVGDGREQAGRLRLDAPPVLPPEVQLPSGVEAHGVRHKVSVAVWTEDVGQFLRDPQCAHASPDLLHLRKLAPRGNAQLGTSLHDPQSGDLQRQALPMGDLDQAIERRVVESPPP